MELEFFFNLIIKKEDKYFQFHRWLKKIKSRKTVMVTKMKRWTEYKKSDNLFTLFWKEYLVSFIFDLYQWCMYYNVMYLT